MLLLDDIEHLKDTYYVSQHQRFIQDLSSNVLQITKPVLYVETLHSCYTHMIEDLFRYYWVIQDLLKANYIQSDDVIFFIKKDNILKYPKPAERTIDSSTKTYKGAWQKLFSVVNKNPILFEHLLEPDTILHFTDLFILQSHDMYQHSPWNSFIYWPGREIPETYSFQHLLKYGVVNDNQIVCRVRYDDTTIQEKLLAFRKNVLAHYPPSINPSLNGKKRVIILDRKDDRAFAKNYLQEIQHFCESQPTLDFQGIQCLEDKPFEDQISLFQTMDIFFAMHGSALTNLLWAKPGSIVVEFDTYDYRFPMFNRLCNLLEIEKHSVHLIPNGTLGNILETTLQL
jgi:hypothetical protein